MEGQEMLPTLQLCPDPPCPRGSGPSVWHRPNEERQKQVSWFLGYREVLPGRARRLGRDSSTTFWRQMRVLASAAHILKLKTDENKESKAWQAGIQKSERGSLEVDCMWRFQCKTGFSFFIFFFSHLSPRGRVLKTLPLSGTWSTRHHQECPQSWATILGVGLRAGTSVLEAA